MVVDVEIEDFNPADKAIHDSLFTVVDVEIEDFNSTMVRLKAASEVRCRFVI